MPEAQNTGSWAEPVVTVDREAGQIESMYVSLRGGVKALGAVQPDPRALVFVYMAPDGLPIGIRMHEAPDGSAVCRLLENLAGLGSLDLRAIARAVRVCLNEWAAPVESSA